jgi:hypothetical protein
VPFLPRARSHLARCLKEPPRSRSAGDILQRLNPRKKENGFGV